VKLHFLAFDFPMLPMIYWNREKRFVAVSFIVGLAFDYHPGWRDAGTKLRQEPEKLVGAAGFEPATPTPPENGASKYASKFNE
jgi:hypothetical protein